MQEDLPTAFFNHAAAWVAALCGILKLARLARLTYGLKPPPARDGHARDAPLNVTPGRLIATKASNGWFIDDPGCLMHVELQMTGLQSPLSLTKSSREGF